MLRTLIAVLQATAKASAAAWSALWTFPSILASAFLVAWGAEAAQFVVSQGLALAILAWLQTLPEFAVEAVIAWEAGKDPSRLHLAIANFTGAIRLLVGLGWPMIYFVAAFFGQRHGRRRAWAEIRLEDEHAIEVVALLPPVLYFLIIYFKGSISLVDGAILTALYAAYLLVLSRIPPRGEEKLEDVGAIPRRIYELPKRRRWTAIALLFTGGGLLLYFTAHPFLESMIALAVVFGISDFVFVQWVAPFLSEFPEKVSAFYWARKVSTAPMALMNMVSSNINQWTVLAAMIPIVYSLSIGQATAFPFDGDQQQEILLTILQCALAVLILANMRFAYWEASLLFVLWFVQFLRPGLRDEIAWFYGVWGALLVLSSAVDPDRWKAFRLFAKLFRKHFLATAPQPVRGPKRPPRRRGKRR